MSKQNIINDADKIVNLMINKKNFNISLSELIDSNTNKEDITILNKISEKLAENGYEITNVSPLKIEKK